MKKFHTTKGFTLVELIIVVSIIAVLASLAFMALSGETAQARDSKRVADIKTFEDAIATSNGKNKKIAYDNSKAVQDSKITTNKGELRPLRGAYLLKIEDGVFDSDVLPTAPRDPKGSNYLGAFLSSTDYQLFATKENPATKIETAVVKGSFKEGAIVDILMADITTLDGKIFTVANPQRFVKGDKIQIDNEEMEIASFNTHSTKKTITVVARASNGTEAKVHNKGASIKLIDPINGADSLLCLGTWVTANTGNAAVDDADWDDNMVSAASTDERYGVLCSVATETIKDDGTVLPYTISN